LHRHIAAGRCSERLSGAAAYLPILEGLECLMCGTALEIIRHYPCPLIQWKVLLSARKAALLCRDSDRAECMLNRAMNALEVLADSIREPKFREKFLASAAI
jgi:hypothetical protein